MSAEEFICHYLEGTEKLTSAYGYNPAEGSDSCGVGLVVALDGKRRRDVVVAGIDEQAFGEETKAHGEHIGVAHDVRDLADVHKQSVFCVHGGVLPDEVYRPQ